MVVGWARLALINLIQLRFNLAPMTTIKTAFFNKNEEKIIYSVKHPQNVKYIFINIGNEEN